MCVCGCAGGQLYTADIASDGSWAVQNIVLVSGAATMSVRAVGHRDVRFAVGFTPGAPCEAAARLDVGGVYDWQPHACDFHTAPCPTTLLCDHPDDGCVYWADDRVQCSATYHLDAE